MGGGSGFWLECVVVELECWELLFCCGELLVLGGYLKGVLEVFVVVLCCGVLVRFECLGVLVDCLVFNYWFCYGLSWSVVLVVGVDGGVCGFFRCLGCWGFLSELVIVFCGYSYCCCCLWREFCVCCCFCWDWLLFVIVSVIDVEGIVLWLLFLVVVIVVLDFRISVVFNYLVEKWFLG